MEDVLRLTLCEETLTSPPFYRGAPRGSETESTRPRAAQVATESAGSAPGLLPVPRGNGKGTD